MKINNKGYFYTLDASIGVLLLIVSLVIILGYYYFAPDREQTDAISHETISILANTMVTDICEISTGSCSCGTTYTNLTTAVCEKAKNTDVSLLSLLAQLYHLEERELIDGIVDELLIETGVHPPQYGLKLLLSEPGSNEQIQLYPVIRVS